MFHHQASNLVGGILGVIMLFAFTFFGNFIIFCFLKKKSSSDCEGLFNCCFLSAALVLFLSDIVRSSNSSSSKSSHHFKLFETRVNLHQAS